jgi:hypothetical protein
MGTSKKLPRGQILRLRRIFVTPGFISNEGSLLDANFACSQQFFESPLTFYVKTWAPAFAGEGELE